jgi:putative membrane protein
MRRSVTLERPPDQLSDETADAVRRTSLASERTELAWWRTGLTALAVALGVGRVIPGLDKSATHWPYEIVGVLFAMYGVAVIAYGSRRRTELERAFAEGRLDHPPRFAHSVLVAAAIALGLLTALLIVVD